MNEIETTLLIITFRGIQLRNFDIPKFRGYLAKKYPQYNLLHNHLENNKLRYAYPQVQFKIIDKLPSIVGIGEGIEVLKKVFMDIDELNIKGVVRRVDEKSILLDRKEFGQVQRAVSYRFLTPWMALNQKNHATYDSLKWNAKRPFLENLIRGNLKSLAKGFHYYIPDFDNLHVQAILEPVVRNFKNNRMICFTGRFSANFLIPDFLGIGKQTARGFGTVVRKNR